MESELCMSFRSSDMRELNEALTYTSETPYLVLLMKEKK